MPPPPVGVQSSILLAVSCASASACIAVGSSTDQSGTVLPLAELWDGTRWQSQPPPSPVDGASLNGVSCSSSSACTAVGESAGKALAERWNGTSWKVESLPKPGGFNLTAVACPSLSTCFAVGTDSNDFAVAERWNGTTWRRLPNPRHPGTVASSLEGVSCWSPSACTATGSYFGGSGSTMLMLAERWDGTAWGVQPTPNPAPAQGADLSAVARPSPSVAIAVGSSAFGETTLAAQWHHMGGGG
jgi:hypothetical protein